MTKDPRVATAITHWAGRVISNGVPLFEGQVAGTGVMTEEDSGAATSESPTFGAGGGELDLGDLGLPTDPDAILRYLTHRYRGVGEKTAETLVDEFGTRIFDTLQQDPDAIERVIPAKRAEQVLEAWRADYQRRTSG